jgi:hypothetical protein
LLRNCIGDFLKTLQDPDLNVRRVALVTFNSAAHNKPTLIRDLLDSVLPHLYNETKVRVSRGRGEVVVKERGWEERGGNKPTPIRDLLDTATSPVQLQKNQSQCKKWRGVGVKYSSVQEDYFSQSAL